jgi:hypothetical protein
VGREYKISSKFMPPYGILLADSTIVAFHRTGLNVEEDEEEEDEEQQQQVTTTTTTTTTTATTTATK